MEGDFKPGAVDKLLRFRPEGFQWMRAFTQGAWDGYIRLFNSNGNSFPAGCVSIIQGKYKSLKVIDERVDPELWDGKVPKTLLDTKLGHITLRPDQRHVIRVALQATRGVLKVATSGGKTEITAGLVLALGVPKTLIVVPNRKLVSQTIKRLEMRLGVRVGHISHGKWEPEQVTVAIPKTLGSAKFRQQRAKLFGSVVLMIIDECHHNPAKEWISLTSKCKAYYRFGLSGTPLDRNDGTTLRLIGTTGPLLVDVRAETLVEQGIIAKPYVEIVEVDKPMLPGNLPYQDAYKLGIVKNINFHKVVVKLIKREYAAGHITLVLVTHIAHGEYLSKHLKVMAPLIPHEFVWSKTKEEALDILVSKFDRGELRVLIASPIFGEGADIPAVDTLIIADAGKSIIKVIQKAGRALRAKHGKENKCRIIDFAHLTHPMLAGHSAERIKVYEREGFTFV